jgi:carbon-monoxide dehydrogenase medium subunit
LVGGALDGVKISADGLLSDLHGSSDYRAHLIKVMTQRALAVLNSMMISDG